ncbi:MAG: hypothetical protein KF744_05900 [Taibaiella sp.]|nr:hypothetical protein [Taibaiella sp.]
MKRFLFALLLLVWLRPVYGQEKVRLVIANAVDSGIIANAQVVVLPEGGVYVANAEGRLTIPLAKHGSQIRLAVSCIGVRDTVSIVVAGNRLNWVLVSVSAQSLSDFVLHSLSAEEVVRKAVAMIPENYANTPYFCYSSYRQYQRMDSTYTNLVEGKPVVMMNISQAKGRLSRKEAYANRIARRTYFVKQPANAYDVNIADLFPEDPVYNLTEKSLEPGHFSGYTFSFDTLLGNDTFYVIKYRSPDFCSDRHGIGNPGSPFPGEAWEEGRVIVDRRSFAIRRVTRNAHRYKSYNYPRYNNFLLPDRLYYMEFVEGSFVAEYKQMGERWYTDKLLYKFTNDYFGSGRQILPGVRITYFYEWQADSFSRYTGDDYASRFYKEMYMWPQTYEPSEWVVNRQPYILTDSAVLFNDLAKRGALEDQFRRNVKPDAAMAKSPGEHVPQMDK